ncbi:MAG TPA: hypothetical protein VIM98_07010 [Dyella sp.]|uniref:hypothetical protein n=1 Tax=Dyella sp. TaxID=1869338 RepID=UPI002F91CE09
MRLNSNRPGYFLACGITSLIALSYGGAALAAPVHGKAQVRLTHVFATLQTGEQDKKPEDVAACRKQVAAVDSRYLGVTVTTQYSIDAQTLIMSASSSLPSPVATKPLQLTIKLAPLGIAGQYAFGAFRPAALPNNFVLFSIGTDFKGANSSILVLNEGKDYNCLVSSDPNPFNSGLGEKFSAGQK